MLPAWIKPLIYIFYFTELIYLWIDSIYFTVLSSNITTLENLQISLNKLNYWVELYDYFINNWI